MLAAINRVIIFVGDVEQSGEFYRNAFGLDMIENTHQPEVWLELDAGGCRLALHKAYGSDGPTGAPQNPHKIVFYAEDVPATREVLVERGASMDDVQSFGDLVLCDGSDPEGHQFQLSNR
jgi:catechol 2,3-dioxygenase-like lactoylglutathione lyase family enzyme